MESFLLQLFIFLASAAIAVPIAKKLGLGSVLGYLIAGIIIGPFGISLIHNIEDVMHFTEFGVVMMLFLVGLELKPSLLWQMRLPIIGIGGAQVLLTSIIISAIAIIFLPWQQALTIGLVLSLSSTAIVLQTLHEKSLMNTEKGQSIFSVLLFQDLAVIPMLALLPLLTTFAVTDGGHHDSALFDISTLPTYGKFIANLLAIFLILIVGKFASQPILRAIAATNIREIFVAAALALVVGISLLMMVVGLSPALGAFLAGVVLADSEYRHELESDIEPFKGLLLGIFFISIGASLNFTLIGDEILLITMLTLGLIASKWLVLVIIGKIFKMQKSNIAFFSIALAQGGEFAFVLFQFSKVNGVLMPSTIDPLISAVALSMFLAPIMFLLHEKYSSNQNINNHTDNKADQIAHSDRKVILAGFGRIGTDIGRFLISSGIKPTILDNDSGNVELLRRLGYQVYYGDVTRLDLLAAAGAEDAELLIIALSNIEKAKSLVTLVKKHYPHIKIIASAQNRASAFELIDLNITHVKRETFGSALDIGQGALQLLGYDPYESHRLMSLFKKKDQEMMPELYEMRNQDEESYISTYRKHNSMLEEMIALDKQSNMDALDKAWTAKNPEI